MFFNQFYVKISRYTLVTHVALYLKKIFRPLLHFVSHSFLFQQTKYNWVYSSSVFTRSSYDSCCVYGSCSLISAYKCDIFFCSNRLKLLCYHTKTLFCVATVHFFRRISTSKIVNRSIESDSRVSAARIILFTLLPVSSIFFFF